ncbi:MAG: exodeoxyribonuclease V subunit alpha [Polyangiaceae bacterium]|nr:exodeoxyribonuclease V subunit alpha [Polyangiaceae bacterium]
MTDVPSGLVLDESPFSALDRQFASTVTALVGRAEPALWLTAAVLSQRTREGSVCMDLGALAGALVFGGGTAERWPGLADWRGLLLGSGLAGEGDPRTPLVLDSRDRLYLFRYWEHEQQLAWQVRQRLGPAAPGFEPIWVRAELARLFRSTPAGSAHGPAPDWQRVAVTLAVASRFSVVTGGPGTGKTHVAVRTLSLLERLQRRKGHAGPKSLLLAPTGKAAVRLVDAVRRAQSELGPDALSGAALDQALTIHRALGASRGPVARFAHDAAHPLVADIVLVDEASMIDLPLMRRLVEATLPSTRIVLLGDADQLSSVQAGAVLGELCAVPRPHAYSVELAESVAELSGELVPSDARVRVGCLDDRVVELRSTRRFSESSGIALLGAALRRGDGAAALAILDQGGAVRRIEPPGSGHLGRAVESLLLDGYAAALTQRDPQAALGRLGEFRVLCAHRRGPVGVERLNRVIEGVLAAAELVRPQGERYPGRPVLIEENDYRAGLFNGDVGLMLPDPTPTGELRVYFPGVDGQVRSFFPGRLPRHETAFAMTVHKSQGSEFEHVLLVLPEPSSPLLTRELLYTAVTRARERVTIVGSAESVVAGAGRRTERASGLGELLRG